MKELTESERKEVGAALDKCLHALDTLDRWQVLEASAFIAAAWVKTMKDLGAYSTEKGMDLMREKIESLYHELYGEP